MSERRPTPPSSSPVVDVREAAEQFTDRLMGRQVGGHEVVPDDEPEGEA